MSVVIVAGVGGVAEGSARAGGAGGAPSLPAPVSAAGGPGLVVEPDDGMAPIYHLMAAATRSLDMTMYQLADPRAVAVLEGDAARGVRVRVLLDQAFGMRLVNGPDASALSAHGVAVRWAPAGTIFHQKTFTIDDRVTVVMTLNLVAEDEATSRDFAVVSTDRTVVSAVEAVFARDWRSTGPPASVFGSEAGGTVLVWAPGALGQILDLIGEAHRSLLVETEELSDRAVVDALAAAARRGVRVQLVMTWSREWSRALATLAAAGVAVRVYAPSARLYIHAKVMVVDGRTAFVGSENFSWESLQANRELGIVVRGGAVPNLIAGVVGRDFAGGAPLGASAPVGGAGASG